MDGATPPALRAGAKRNSPWATGLDDLVGLFRASAYLPNGLGAFVLASHEALRVERARGNVDATLNSVGVGAAYRSRGSLAFDARLGAHLRG